MEIMVMASHWQDICGFSLSELERDWIVHGWLKCLEGIIKQVHPTMQIWWLVQIIYMNMYVFKRYIYKYKFLILLYLK